MQTHNILLSLAQAAQSVAEHSFAFQYGGKFRGRCISGCASTLSRNSPSKSARTQNPLYYDGANLNTSSIGAQVFEITSLAVLSNGSQNRSQKLLQYICRPRFPSICPPFPGL